MGDSQGLREDSCRPSCGENLLKDPCWKETRYLQPFPSNLVWFEALRVSLSGRVDLDDWQAGQPLDDLGIELTFGIVRHDQPKFRKKSRPEDRRSN